MADLAELLGTILVGVAHARRMADEEAAAIAEAYRDEPLLEGMSVPRIRLPEIVLEAPMLIDSHQEADVSVLEDTDRILGDLSGAFDRGEEQAGVTLPSGFRERFARTLRRILDQAPSPRSGARSASAESVIRATDSAYSNTVRQIGPDYRRSVSPEQEGIIRGELRAQARRSALKKIGSPPRFDVTLTTADVKERANSKNSARLKLVIREEGVEWAVAKDNDGTIKGTLTPE